MSNQGACARFKQNAWKKELCSNCYRPKEEHAEAPKPPVVHLPLLTPSQGILVHVKSKKKVKKKSVSFTKEESEVIGYGGVDSGSEDEDDYIDWEDSGKEEEREVVGEEEKALERLTKTNTDYNSILGNLSGSGILPLGKQQKQTLQVTVQPFSMTEPRKPYVNKLLEELPLITTKTDPPLKETKVEEVKKSDKDNDQPMPLMKTIIIENKSPKEEVRANPEGRKTQITRGNVITKTQGGQVKNKLYIQSVINGKSDNKRSVTQQEKKTDSDINKIIINTGPNVEEKNNRNLQQNSEKKFSNSCVKDNEVTVKVLKLVGDGLAESREMAGEPDGKADSDEPETPLTPPPRSSFLHRDSTLFKDISTPKSPSPNQDNTKDTPIIRELIHKDDSPNKESQPQVIGGECRLPSPSGAPPPIPSSPPPNSSPAPSPSPVLSSSSAISFSTAPTTSPVPSISPAPNSSPVPSTSPVPYSPSSTPSPPATYQSLGHSPPASPPARTKRPAPKPPVLPDPSPRRRGSLGDDKKKTRMRHTLRKLLRFGSREEEVKTPEDEGPPRPRPQIIHPLDLNKSAVQVLPPSSGDRNSSEIYASTTSTANYSTGRPSKPPPPPRSESLNLMERLKPMPNSENNVYANLGEGRCGIAPVKPQRTGSLRDSTSPAPKEPSSREKESPQQSSFQSDSDNVYECVGVSSAPECDMSLPPYYGSETESDIYYPYITFQNGECKTKVKRKERGIVHSTLEENYSAVTVANLETLSHLLQQTFTRKPEVPKGIQELELKLSNFHLEVEDTVRVGKFCFINSKCKDLPVTLAIGPAELDIPDIMEPLSSFKCATLPSKIVENDIKNGLVTVMNRKKVERLSVYARKLEKSAESVREGVHILLQVVKHLLASKGKVNTDNFIVFTSKNTPCAAYLPSEENETVKTEDCLKEMCKRLIGPLPLGRVLEKCSLGEAESVLEVWLWGPASPLALPSLARWLDLERANFLNTLICSQNSPVDREQLAFLVRATPKSIAHASQVIELNAS